LFIRFFDYPIGLFAYFPLVLFSFFLTTEDIMIKKNYAILLVIMLIFCVSCGDDPTSSDSNGEETIRDIDGNTYKIVKIGDQWWMTENLKVTHYRNGDPISNVTVDSLWVNLQNGAYCDHLNNADNTAMYGRLYNWYTVNDHRIIAPEGWRVPSNADWQELIDHLGGQAVAGGKMKQSGTEQWNNPNHGATNESGFTAIPVGIRSNSGYFIELGINSYFWSKTESNLYIGYRLHLSYGHAQAQLGGADKQLGYSLRCIKN